MATENANMALVITRAYNAPRELVYKAWTSAEHMAKWWGPAGFQIKISGFEFKPGGTFLYSMAANGQELWGKFIYREMVMPERIVFISSFSDKDGNTTTNPWMPGWPLEVLNTVTFTEQDGKTTLTINAYPINATTAQQKLFTDSIAALHQGFKGTFDQLEAYLKNIE